MPRCFKPSLTKEVLNAELHKYNRHKLSVPPLFDKNRTRRTINSITVYCGEDVITITINHDTGALIYSSEGVAFTAIKERFGDPSKSIEDVIFQHVSDVDGNGCGAPVVPVVPVVGAAVGGAGGPGAVPAPVPLMGENPIPGGRANSPPFVFEEEDAENPARKSERKRRNTRKNRKNRKTRKNTRRRHRTKQNRY